MKKLMTQCIPYLGIVSLTIALILAMSAQDGKYLFLQWVAMCLLWMITLWNLGKPDLYRSIVNDKAFLIYIIFIIWAVFSSFILSESKALSIVMLVPFASGLLSYFIGYTSDKNIALFFYKLLLVIGLFLVAYTCYQAFILDIKRPSATFYNWNTLAAFLAMILLPWVLRYALQPVSAVQLVFWCFVSLLFAFAMGLTLSRGALLIFISVFCCFYLFSYKQRLFSRQGVLLLLSLVLGYIFSSLCLDNSIFQRLNSTLSPALGSELVSSAKLGRHLLWSAAWQMYLEHPFLGWGLGVFSLLHKQYTDPLSIDLGYFVHNDYLQILLELGPIGLLIFISFIVILLKKLYILIFKASHDTSEYTVEAFILLSTCIGMLVHTFVTFHLYQITMQIIFGFYLGQASQCLSLAEGKSFKLLSPSFYQNFKWVYRSFCTFILIFMTIFGLAFYYTDKGYSAKNKQEILDSYSIVNLLFPLSDRYDSVSAKYLLDQLKLLSIKAETRLKREQIGAMALNAAGAAIEKMPLNPANYITKAEILKQMQGGVISISEQYEKALRLKPDKIQVRYDYAYYLVEQQTFKKALTVLWGAWGRINVGYYRNGIDFLGYHLEINRQYGNAQETQMIEREIQRLMKLEKKSPAGYYVFTLIRDKEI